MCILKKNRSDNFFRERIEKDGRIAGMLYKTIFIVLQCTWGLPQTLIGLGFYIVNSKHPHKVYRGCIDTQWNYYGGISLGLFIFTPSDEHSNASLIRVHEYGHCIQSLVLGPFMLFVGIISIIWGDLPYFAKLRKEKNLPYTACFVEAWASKWGEMVTGEKAIWE